MTPKLKPPPGVLVDLDYSYSAFEQRGGYNSEILHVHYHDGKRAIVKRVGAKKGGFVLAEAEEMAYDIVAYQKELEALGIPVPPIEKVVLEYNIDTRRASIVVTCLWAGQDVEKIIEGFDLERNPRELTALIKEMCEILACVYKRKENYWEVVTGIDPKCSNFTKDETGKVWFVDPFPPRYRKSGSPIVEWPHPRGELGKKLGYFKHFDIRGIILGLVAQLSRIKPGLRKFFEQQVFIEEFPRLIPPQAMALFMEELYGSTWYKIGKILNSRPILSKDAEAVKGLIKESLESEIFGVNYSVYTLREIALEFAYQGFMNLAELEKFFKESHFEDGLPKETTDALQLKLCGFLERRHVSQ